MGLKEQILKVEEMINAQILQKKEVCIHIHAKNHACRNVIEIDECKLDADGLHISGGWYILDLNNPLIEIELENGVISPNRGVALRFDDETEVCIDFN